MLSIDDICTLANVIIVDPTQVYLILLVASYCEVVATMVTWQKKDFTKIDIMSMNFFL
jgi:hypothetical protein